MLHKYISNVNEFREILERNKQRYLLASDLPATKVYLQVEGKFNAEDVVWNMCIRTIAEYSHSFEVSDDPKQFIDIKLIKDIYQIEIGLNISEIDRSTIERTIIMIRKYKRLRLGRHEYGARSKTI